MGLLSSIASIAKDLGQRADAATRQPAPALAKAPGQKPVRRPVPEKAPYFGPEIVIGAGIAATLLIAGR